MKISLSSLLVLHNWNKIWKIFTSNFNQAAIKPYNLACFKDRLKPLENHVAETGEVLTESQHQALERKLEETQAHGESETEHHGYLGSQDTFYVDTLKGVGR